MKEVGKMKCVYFIPYAAGEKCMFDDLVEEIKKLSDEEIKLIPMDLSGLGARRREKLYDSIEEGADDIIEQIKLTHTEGDEVYILGYCMGGVIAYGVYRKMQDDNYLNLKKVFLCAVGVNPRSKVKFDDIVTDLLEEHIERFVKIQNEKLKAEIMEYYQVICKHFGVIIDKYYRKGRFKLGEDIVMINGNQDPMVDMKFMKLFIKGYRKVTQYMLDGDHMFLFKNNENVATIMYNEIMK